MILNMVSYIINHVFPIKYDRIIILKIRLLCWYFDIRDYTINSDMSIDVHRTVNLNYRRLRKLPLQFNVVEGSFLCVNNRLTSLKGAPVHVKKSFICNSNRLKSLKYMPIFIGNNFECENNKLVSLSGCPKKIYGYFRCDFNKINSLEDGPEFIGTCFSCTGNPIEKNFYKFNFNYILYKKYLHRQKVLNRLIND